MRKNILIVLAFICGVSCLECSAKKRKKHYEPQIIYGVVDDSLFYYQDGEGEGFDINRAHQDALYAARRALKMRVSRKAMNIEEVSVREFFDPKTHKYSAEIIIRSPKWLGQTEPQLEKITSPNDSIVQLCDAVDDELYIYQAGEGKSGLNRSIAQTDAISNAKSQLQSRFGDVSMDLEMVCNKFYRGKDGVWVANVVVRIPKNQEMSNNSITE